MKIAPFLLIVFSGFYLIDAPISPVYIVFILALFCIICSRFIPRASETFQICMWITILVVIGIQLISGLGFSHSAINVLFSLLYGVVTFWVCTYTSKEMVLKCCDKFVLFTIGFLTIEMIWRFLHPVYSQELIKNGIGYYQYKLSSIIFEDSNFVGLYAMSSFFMVVFLEKYCLKSYKKQKLILIFLTIATFSKGAIATLLLYNIIFSTRLKKSHKILILSSVGTVAIYKLYQQIMFDGSLWERNYVVTKSIEYYLQSSFVRKLLGNGFGYISHLPFKGGHNILAVLFIESGAIGTISIIGAFLMIGKKYKDTLLITIPFLLATNATYAHANSYLYCMVAVIVALSLKRASEHNIRIVE